MNRKIGVMLSYILMVFEVMSTLLLTPFIIRTLGQSEFGVYKLSSTVNAYLLLLDLGVGNAIIRYIAKYRANNEKESEQKFLGVATLYYSAIAIITLLIGFVIVAMFSTLFLNGLNQEEIELGKKLLTITMVNSAITLGTSAYNNVLIAYEKYSISRGTSIAQIVVRMILTYIALRCGWRSTGIVVVNLIMTIVCRLFFCYYVIVKIRLKPIIKGVNFSFIKDIVSYSSFILLQMVATQINASADQVLLGIFVKSSSIIIGVYSVGTQIVQYFQSIGSSFNGILMPGVVKLVENGADSGKICDEMIRIGRLIFMVLGIIWSTFLIFGKQFVVLWAGENNSAAYYVTAILMTAYVIILSQSIGTQILWAKNEHKEQSFLKLGIVVINIFGTIILIKWNALLGATIGTFISLFIGDIMVMNIIYKKKLKISLKKYYIGITKGIVPAIGASAACGVLISWIDLHGWIGLGINIVCMLSIYALLMLIFGFSKYERELIKSMFKGKKI